VNNTLLINKHLQQYRAMAGGYSIFSLLPS
jgi:hypothetical protein